jgi:transposase
VAPSTFRGKPTGPAIHAHARILGGDESAYAGRAIASKHQMLHGFLVPLVHRLRRNETVHIELKPITADTITVDLLTRVGDHRNMKPYSEDLRRRIVKALQEGSMSKSAAARLFDVSLSSVKRYARIASRGASLEPRRGGGRPPKVDQTTQKLLEEDVQERPAATVSERRHFLEQLTGKSLGDSTIRRVLKRLGLSRKNGLWGRWNGTSG